MLLRGYKFLFARVSPPPPTQMLCSIEHDIELRLKAFESGNVFLWISEKMFISSCFLGHPELKTLE